MENPARDHNIPMIAPATAHLLAKDTVRLCCGRRKPGLSSYSSFGRKPDKHETNDADTRPGCIAQTAHERFEDDRSGPTRATANRSDSFSATTRHRRKHSALATR